MKKLLAVAIFVCAASLLWAEAPSAGDTALTIYNGNFAVVRNRLTLDLTAGVNTVDFAGTTTMLEPDSVILRDPTGARRLQVLEQNYRNDPVTQELLLSLYEGKTIDFLVPSRDGRDQVIVKGKIIRSGYVSHTGYNNTPYQQPIIEVDGQLRFSLPGQPLFPALTGDTILKPRLTWQLETDKPGKFDAEVAYVTGGMSWQADYNLVAPVKGDTIDLVGWVTINNQSGSAFENARIKLLAGDVNKIQNRDMELRAAKSAAMDMVRNEAAAPAVTERSFDEFHMYTLERPTTLHDHEMKQVEFVSAASVTSKRLYVYDGFNQGYYGYYPSEQARVERDFGLQSNNKVYVVQEFQNSKANNLGMPLPKGRLRFYRRDIDGHLEFTGESMIDHTPKDETVRVYTGNAFDLVGNRKRTNFQIDSNGHWMDETFEIHLRNHKSEAVTFTVMEHMYRWTNWKIVQQSHPWTKKDAQLVQFAVQVPANGEQVVTYTVHYSW